MLPGRLLGQAVETLRAARSAALKTDRARLNNVLANAFAPLLERFAVAGPKHWQQYSGQALQLRMIIGQHLDIEQGRIGARVARSTVSAMRTNWDGFIGMGRKEGGWPSLASYFASTFEL